MVWLGLYEGRIVSWSKGGRVERTMLVRQCVRSLSYSGGRVPPTTQNVINGAWAESSTDRWIDVNNPATNKIVTRFFIYTLKI